jgi:hypothetical protein
MDLFPSSGEPRRTITLLVSFESANLNHCEWWETTSLLKRKLRRVALVRTDVSEKSSASIIRVTRICEIGTLAVPSNRRMLRRNTAARVGC